MSFGECSVLMNNDMLQSRFYNAFMPYTNKGTLPAIFTTQDEDQHKQLKSPIAYLYNLSNVTTFESFVDEVLEVLFQQLDQRFVNQNEVCDLGNWLQYFAFDTMGTMTFSARYGFLEKGSDVESIISSIWNFMLTVGPVSSVFHSGDVLMNLKYDFLTQSTHR